MNKKLLFTAALMSAASLASQQVYGAKRIVTDKSVYEYAMGGLQIGAEDGQVDLSGWVMRNAKMSTLSTGMYDGQMGWKTGVTGGNFRIYAIPNDPNNKDVILGECPCPNGVERWKDASYHYEANTKIIYQDAKLPQGKYTVVMWAECQNLGDHTLKDGMQVFANENAADITTGYTMTKYELKEVIVGEDGLLSLGIKTGERGSDNNHIVLSAVSILADQSIVDAVNAGNPMDMSGAMSNASCMESYGWKKDPLNRSAGYNVNNSAINSEAYAGMGIEYWTDSNVPTKNADLIWQEIKGLPAGSYKVTAVAMGRAQGGGDVCAEGLYLFANSGQEAVSTNVWGEVSVVGTVADGTLRVGLRASENNGNNWLAISRVKVEYLGEDMGAMADALKEKVEEAHILVKNLEGQVPTAYLEELGAVKEESCTTSEEFAAAIAEIDNLIAEVNLAKADFASNYLNTKGYAESLKNMIVTEETAKNELQSAIDAASDKAFASKEKEVWAIAGNELLASCKAFYKKGNGFTDEVANLDVTPLMVVNPGFEDNTVDGWTCGEEPDMSHGMPFFGFNAHWAPTLDFYQEIDAPNGLYRVSVQEHATIGDKTDLYIQSSEARATAKMNWNHGGSVEQAVVDWAADKERNRVGAGNVLVVDGKVRIGVNVHKSEARLQLFFDNFRLTLVNDGAQEIQGLYDAKLTEAQAIDEAYLPEKLQAVLKQAIEMPVATLDERYAAYNALKQAVEECASVVGISKDIAGLLEECSIYKENSTADQETVNAFEIAIKTAEGYVQLETVEELQICYEALENARRTFVQSATPMGEQQFDMTFMLKNPDVSGFGSWSAVEGWNGDNMNVAGWGVRAQHNAAQTGETSGDAFFECYADGVLPDGLWAIYQTVNLSSGFYTMRLATFAGPVNNVPGTGEAKVALYAGEKRGDEVKSTALAYREVSFCQSTEGEMRLGVKTEEGNLANWIGCNDMKLYKVAPKAEALALDESKAYDVKADMYADVTLQRKLVAGKWNTFCVPFALTAEQIEANKLGEVRRLGGMQASGKDITLDFGKVDAVEAGVPYLVKPVGTVTEIKADGVMVSAKQPEAFPMNLVSMTGNYGATTVPQGAYFINDDMFYLADQADKVSLKGFRAYINVESESPVAGVNRLLIEIDGSVTRVGEVLGNTAEDGGKIVDVFTLSGVKVKVGVKKAEALRGLERGIYIVDGKKVIK